MMGWHISSLTNKSVFERSTPADAINSEKYYKDSMEALAIIAVYNSEKAMSVSSWTASS
jgi:hypothetical protein